MLLMNSKTENYRGARGKLGLWRRKLWPLPAMAEVKLLACETGNLTREGGSPVSGDADGRMSRCILLLITDN